MGYVERIDGVIERFLHLNMTRGEFILSGIGGATAMTGLGLYTAGRNTPIDSKYEIYPGCIESHIPSPFLQVDKGHFHFIREGILNNPDVLAVTQDFFGEIGKHLDEKQLFPLGEALKFCQEKMLDRIKGKTISPDANLELEALHGAFFAFTAGYTAQWFSMEDLHFLGVSEKFKNPEEYFWGPEGVARWVYPGYFSTGLDDDPANGETKNQGQDRSCHITNHAFLAFELMYSAAYGLGLDRNMPFFARFLVWFGNFGSLEHVITKFSDRVGLFYEISRMVNPKNWPVDGRSGRTIADGILDDAVWDDYKGNRLGSQFGMATKNYIKYPDLFEGLLFEIDHKFKKDRDLPILDQRRRIDFIFREILNPFKAA